MALLSGSLKPARSLTPLPKVVLRAPSAQQALSVRCGANRTAADRQVAKPSALQHSLLAAAASLAISLAPQPAVASALTAFTPQEIAQVAQAKSLLPEDQTFRPEESVPGNSTAQEAAARANPTPFDPAVVGGTAGLLLLAFAFSTGRADPQLKMNSGKTPSGGAQGADPDRVAAVKDRKKQARAWIGDWQKRTKNSA